MAVPGAEGTVFKDFPGGCDFPDELTALVDTKVTRLNCSHFEPPFAMRPFPKLQAKVIPARNLADNFSLSNLSVSGINASLEKYTC
jgi:hypothetical protein